MQAGPATRACPPKEDTMQITRIRALRGPNLWTRSTAIEAIVQCEPGECDYSALPGFEDRLRARFPKIGTLQPHGADQRLSLAQVLEVAALSLQAQRSEERRVGKEGRSRWSPYH